MGNPGGGCEGKDLEKGSKSMMTLAGTLESLANRQFPHAFDGWQVCKEEE
jgi:hypothetical protein